MEEVSRLKHEHEDALAKMYNFMTSDLLTENPDVSQSNLGPHRRIGYLYKGMTAEEKQKVREYQLAQIQDAKVCSIFTFLKFLTTFFVWWQKQKELEKRMDREYEDFLNGTQQTISLMDKEELRKHRYVLQT